MRGFECRGLRLLGFAALGMVLGLPAMAATATQTRISAETRDTAGRTRATVSIAVAPENGGVATGSVVLKDGETQLAGSPLGADGTATIAVDLLPGSHNLTAVYSGDPTHAASTSDVQVVSAATSATPGFTVAVSPASMSLTAGTSGSAIVSVTPVNASSLTAPMFVTVSCSGLPDQSSCTFTPATLEILPNTTAAVTSSIVIATQGPNTRSAIAVNHGVNWAILLPGALGFAGLAFSARRRRWLMRLSLITLVGFVATMGMTACAPRYNYFNHGPNYNLPTPSGDYKVVIAAQSSDGVTAITDTSASIALTVK